MNPRDLIKGWRTPGNQRRYLREVLRRVAIIKVAQRVGIPLASIRDALMTLPEGHRPRPRTGASYPPDGKTN